MNRFAISGLAMSIVMLLIATAGADLSSGTAFDSPVVYAKLNTTDEPVVVKRPVIDKFTDRHRSAAEIKALRYDRLPQNGRSRAQLRAGNTRENIRGFQSSNERFVIHILACNHEKHSCSFRVNGAATGALYAQVTENRSNAVWMGSNFVMKVDSISLDNCDGRRFCDYHFEAYDAVEISIIPASQVIR